MPFIDFMTVTLSTGGLYTLLALCFAFVWWSSRTFFITAAGILVLAGSMVFHLVFNLSWNPVGASVLAIGICSTLGVLLEVMVFGPISRKASLASGARSGVSEDAILGGAIISFALYFVLINIVQWWIGSETDSVTLRTQGMSQYSQVSIFGLHLPLRTNTIGLWQLMASWGLSLGLALLLQSRIGLSLRALKSNPQLFNQITGRGTWFRIMAMMFCCITASLAGIVTVFTSRLDMSGGLTIVLGAMVVMILATQRRSLGLLPIIAIIFAGMGAFLQGHGYSFWVEPIVLLILLLALVVNPKHLISEIKRVEESPEA
ncbi:MAG: hypothetical protein WC299_06210 [Kiritimatiellia bacterium]